MERAAGTRLTAFILRESRPNVTPFRGIYVWFRLVLAHEVRNQEGRQRGEACGSDQRTASRHEGGRAVMGDHLPRQCAKPEQEDRARENRFAPTAG